MGTMHCTHRLLVCCFVAAFVAACDAKSDDSPASPNDGANSANEAPPSAASSTEESAPAASPAQPEAAMPPDPGDQPTGMEAGLRGYLSGSMTADQLKITYDDLHGLHGGLSLEIAGTGAVTQSAKAPGGESAGQPKESVSTADMRQLVELLLELQAWEQRVPERELAADESVVHLRIVAGPHSSDIWEFYNDLGKTDRIARVKTLMTKIAWK